MSSMAPDFDLTQIPEKPGGVLDLPEPPTSAPAPQAPVTDATASAGMVGTMRSPYVDLNEDPDLAPVEEPSDLDLLSRDVAAAVATTVVLPVAGREMYAVRFSSNISNPEVDNYRSRSRGDELKFDSLLIATKAEAIIREGRELRDAEGQPLNFRHRQFMDALKVKTAAEAVKAFYVLDGVINSVSNSLLREAGWGRAASPEPDPTSGD